MNFFFKLKKKVTVQGSAEDMGILCAGHDVTALAQLPQMLTAMLLGLVRCPPFALGPFFLLHF